jgi:hypothetical protein
MTLVNNNLKFNFQKTRKEENTMMLYRLYLLILINFMPKKSIVLFKEKFTTKNCN